MIYKRRADIHKAFKVLENAIETKEAELKRKFKEPQYPALVNNLVANSFEAVNTSIGKFEDIVSGGQAFVQLVAIKAQKELGRNPWSFVGKVALGSFGLGLILGSRYRNSRSRARK